MALLKVRRPTLRLFGRIFKRGDTIESRDFPSANQYKWAQLIDHRLVDLVDKPGEPFDPEGKSRDEIVTAVAATTEVPLPKPEGRRICPDCDFVANTPHGLKVHAGRAHKKE